MGFNTTLSHGKYLKLDKPLTESTLGELEGLGKLQIAASKGAKEFGLPENMGSSALGAYQFINPTREAYGKKLYGEGWRDVKYTPEVQEQMAKALYDATPNDKMKGQWASWEEGRVKQGWDKDKEYIMARESGGVGTNDKIASKPVQQVENKEQRPIELVSVRPLSEQLAQAEVYKQASAERLAALGKRPEMMEGPVQIKKFNAVMPSGDIAAYSRQLIDNMRG